MNRSLSFLGFVLKYIRVSDIHAHAHTKLATFWILEISIFVDKAKKDTFNWIIICCVLWCLCVCSFPALRSPSACACVLQEIFYPHVLERSVWKMRRYICMVRRKCVHLLCEWCVHYYLSHGYFRKKWSTWFAASMVIIKQYRVEFEIQFAHHSTLMSLSTLKSRPNLTNLKVSNTKIPLIQTDAEIRRKIHGGRWKLWFHKCFKFTVN